MPFTVNGIGTSYYGKRDAASRMGQCRNCGARAQLESYTSRLWFVVLFIPLIPIKRVRILDYCPQCNRHWVANPEQYETSRQLAVSSALEKYRDHPSTETALVAHAQLISFHMHKEADEFRKAVLEQFPDDVDVRLGLGSHLDQVSRWADATPIYEQALELNPDHPSARHAMAWRRLNEKKLDEAYHLLDFLRQPGAGQTFDLGLLEVLARSYQEQKNHERTLEICQHLLREVPQAGQNHEFRKLVSKSERALHQSQTLLPEKSFSLLGLFDSKSGAHAKWVPWALFGSIAAVLFLIGMASMNEYQRTHRKLFVINGFSQPMHVSVDGKPPVVVNQKEVIYVAEGKHQISITSPFVKQADVALETGYWLRFTHSPLWIYNPEKLMAISENTIHYAVAPQPPTIRWLMDMDFNYVQHVDYAFETPPQTIQLGKNQNSISKIHVGTANLPPATVLLGLNRVEDKSLAMTYAEGHLNRNPQDDGLLVIYSHFADDDNHQQRVAEFLKAGLWRSPLSVQWHRTYTDLKSVRADEEALVRDYDAHLQKDPDNSRLMYLRGRVGLTRADQLHYYHLAYDKEPQSGWPAYALGYDAANRGDWAEAEQYCDKALAALRSDLRFRSLRHGTLMANGKASVLEAEYRPLLQSPDSMQAMTGFFMLIDALAAQQKSDEARQMARQWFMTNWGPPAGGPDASAMFDVLTDYLCGNLERMRQDRDKPTIPSLLQFKFHTLLALGDPDAAIKLEGVNDLLRDWHVMLSVSLAYSLAGNPAEADQWRSRACDELKAADSEGKRAAALLQRDQPPTQNELDEIVLGISGTPVFLAVLSQRFPDHKSELNQRARIQNVSRMPPSLLVKQAVETP